MSWREVMSHRQAWGLVVSRFFLDPIWWLFVNWLPIYLADRDSKGAQDISVLIGEVLARLQAVKTPVEAISA